MWSGQKAASQVCVGLGLMLMLSACGAFGEEDVPPTQNKDGLGEGTGNSEAPNNNVGSNNSDMPNNVFTPEATCDEETNICTTCDSRDICWNYDAASSPYDDDEENNATPGPQGPRCEEHECEHGDMRCGERGLIEYCDLNSLCHQWKDTASTCEPSCGADDLDCECPERIWDGNLQIRDDLGDYTIVTGSLRLFVSEETSELSRFRCLRHVGGNVSIEGRFTSLDGLNSLVSVGGSLEIEASYLQNVDGLSGLQFVGQSIILERAAGLQNVDGFSSLTTVGRNLHLSGFDNLENVDGLSSLVSVGGGFALLGGDKLENIDGLSSLESVGLSLNITYNARLQNFDGLSSLTSTGGLAIRHNPRLQNVDGLSSLTTITGESVGGLYFEDNALLDNLDGLSSLTSNGDGFFIFDHPLLCQDDAEALMTSLGAPRLLERYKVRDNDGVCP